MFAKRPLLCMLLNRSTNSKYSSHSRSLTLVDAVPGGRLRLVHRSYLLNSMPRALLQVHIECRLISTMRSYHRSRMRGTKTIMFVSRLNSSSVRLCVHEVIHDEVLPDFGPLVFRHCGYQLVSGPSTVTLLRKRVQRFVFILKILMHALLICVRYANLKCFLAV